MPQGGLRAWLADRGKKRYSGRMFSPAAKTSAPLRGFGLRFFQISFSARLYYRLGLFSGKSMHEAFL